MHLLSLILSGTVADWFVAAGTFLVAVVAVFQDAIRGYFYRPAFDVSVKTAPPDCVAVPFTRQDGTFLGNAVYLRVWIENEGNTTARNVEVDAKELRLKRADGNWERVAAFPPMNLRWANVGVAYFPRIAPKMGKHCDLGHIVDPQQRHVLNEDNPRLNLNNNQTSLTFDLIAAPNHRGHIVGPGEYQLDVLVAAENARPLAKTVSISLSGDWHPDETRMLRDGIGLRIM